jgi:hypothetical protein
MLQIRLEGAEPEARAFLDALAAAGVEVQVGTVKDRGEFAHVYAVVRMPNPPTPAGPVRATAFVGQAIAGRRPRTPRRRG